MKPMRWHRLQLLLYPILWGVVRVQLAWAEIDNSKPLLPDNDKPTRLMVFFESWTLAPEPGIQPFFTYFNMVWPWIIGVASGVAVLQGIIGGIEIMLSGSDTGKREGGKSKIMWSLAGLVMIVLSGLILQTLNSQFYIQQ